MEKLIEELTKVNPSNLSEEGLKLFNKINEVIDRNEELEKAIHHEYELGRAQTEYEVNEYWKSLIKEKIEELDKEEKELQDSISEEEREEYSDANISFELMDIEIRRSVLQELLERRKQVMVIFGGM